MRASPSLIHADLSWQWCRHGAVVGDLGREVRNPNADWIVLADHDMWVHPMALKDASLDLYLDTVPPHKLFAHANYHR